MRLFPRKNQGILDDGAFINDIYRGLLGRDPDENGMHRYCDLLREGNIDGVGLINAIRLSEEFKARTTDTAPRPASEPQSCLRWGPRPYLTAFKDIRVIAGQDSLRIFSEASPP